MPWASQQDEYWDMSTQKTYQNNTPNRTDIQRADRLYAAVDQFEYGAELAKRVYHLGTPRFVNSCPTASLTVGQEGQPAFTFNRAYFDNLGHNEMVFVVLHETLHLAFRHPWRRHDRSPALWNIACDLVVNAFLLQKAGFGAITDDRFGHFLASAVTFETLPIALKDSQLTLTAEQVYDLLGANTGIVQRNASKIKGCDEHEWAELDLESISEQRESTSALTEQAQETFREWLASWGDKSSGELRAIGEVHQSVKVAWDLILSRRIASCVQRAIEQRWAPPNRKTAWLYPDLLLPTDCEMEQFRRSVLIAIDASGSIAPAVLDRLVAVARSVPPGKVQVRAISFDAAVYPVDLWAEPPKILGGGGTSFAAVEAFTDRLSRYPDLVVVLTDGFAPRPTVRHPDRWFWLITEGGTTRAIEGIGRNCLIGGSC